MTEPTTHTVSADNAETVRHALREAFHLFEAMKQGIAVMDANTLEHLLQLHRQAQVIMNAPTL